MLADHTDDRIHIALFTTMAATRFVDDDEWFCGAVRQAGLRLLCDGRVLCTCTGLRRGLHGPAVERARGGARGRHGFY